MGSRIRGKTYQHTSLLSLTAAKVIHKSVKEEYKYNKLYYISKNITYGWIGEVTLKINKD